VSCLTTSDSLADLLQQIGVDVRRSDHREISGRCPVHHLTVGKEDNSPSWSMNAETGLWICFSCGARGTLGYLVSTLTGEEESILTVHRMLIDAGLNRLNAPERVKQEAPVDWVAYGKFGRVPPRMLNARRLDPDVAWRYGVRWDTEAKAWITPIVSPLGELNGWQAKKVGWVRNHPEGVQKSDTLFGIERFVGQTAVLVESPLDVVRLGSVFDRPQGLSSFGSFVSETQMRLLASVASSLIVAMDNDDAGLSSSKRLFKSLPNFRRGVRWLNYRGINAKDIGDMTADEIERAVRTSTVLPPWI
jgi:DNA primase